MKIVDDNGYIFDEDHLEMVGRYVKNAFGQRERVELRQDQWDYFDWLAETQGYNVENYIQKCDETRGTSSFSDALQWWCFWLFEKREEEGKPRPEWLPPLAD